MFNIPPTVYRPVQDAQDYVFALDKSLCTVRTHGGETLVCQTEIDDGHVRLKITLNEVHEKFSLLLAVMLDGIFGHLSDIVSARVSGTAEVTHLNVFKTFSSGDHKIELSREQFVQIPKAWHRSDPAPSPEVVMTVSENREHPVRPPISRGLYYRRFVPSLRRTISFRTIEISRDLDVFHEWQNQPRVYDLWDLNKSRDELRTYLEKSLADLHQIPMIVEVDGEPAGYFEIYWIAEDRLAPFYNYDMFDRGFHFLIGNKKFLGSELTGAIVRSVMHMIFLDDPRTQLIAVEPRSDNKKVIRYAQLIPGWRFIKEFDFPHKRAALITSKRADFFREGGV